MRIACLAWGSLVWDPRNLQITSPWFSDGPSIPVEFARESVDRRLTLVLGNNFQLVQSLWAWMTHTVIADAVDNLRVREGTITSNIGVWNQGLNPPVLIPDLSDWAKDKGANAVIWTALQPKFMGTDGRVPTITEAVNYLQSLDPQHKQGAEEYVRKTPIQVRTPYRDEFEIRLGWQ